MGKTLSDMSRHLKSIIVPKTLEEYTVNPMFEDFASDEDIRTGIFAWGEFLHKFCDTLIADSQLYDDHKESKDEHLSSIYANFPFLDNTKKLLLRIGIKGELSEDNHSIVAGSDIFNHNLSTTKSLEILRFLTDCGMCFDGIDINEKRQKLSEIPIIDISYPETLAMILGLKVMAVAEKKLGTTLNQNALMRCDYRILKNYEADPLIILEETIEPLPENIKDFVMSLHQLHLDKGLNCVVEVRGYWRKIKYSCGKTEIWGINTSLNNGFEVTVKAKNTHKYAEAISNYPPALQKLIAKGYGCGKKRGISETCDAGCEGLRIALDDSVLDIKEGITDWFTQEISCFRRK